MTAWIAHARVPPTHHRELEKVRGVCEDSERDITSIRDQWASKLELTTQRLSEKFKRYMTECVSMHTC